MHKSINGDINAMAALMTAEKAPRFISKHKLSVLDYRVCLNVLSDISNCGSSQTINANVARLFKEKGFEVSFDENKVNYLIREG